MADQLIGYIVAIVVIGGVGMGNALKRYQPVRRKRHQREIALGIGKPDAVEPEKLHAYTLGHQVTEPYDFTAAIRTAAHEFAPDLFIVTGPGTTLGGAVAQSLILARWRGMGGKADFQKLQAEQPMLVAMGLPEQRALATQEGAQR